MKTNIALWLCLSTLACVTFGQAPCSVTEETCSLPDGTEFQATINFCPAVETSIKVYNSGTLEIEVVHDYIVDRSYIRPAGSVTCYVLTSLPIPTASAYNIVYDSSTTPPSSPLAAAMCDAAQGVNLEGAQATVEPSNSCTADVPTDKRFYICKALNSYWLCDK